MCYIWLESYGCVDSHYQLLNNVPGTRLAPDFCQQFGTQIITPSETLSYVFVLIIFVLINFTIIIVC